MDLSKLNVLGINSYILKSEGFEMYEAGLIKEIDDLYELVITYDDINFAKADGMHDIEWLCIDEFVSMLKDEAPEIAPEIAQEVRELIIHLINIDAIIIDKKEIQP